MQHFRNISIEGRAIPEDVDPKDWNVDRYERAVLALLRQLDASTVGRIVLTFIAGDIVIKPLPFARRMPNAYATVASGQDVHTGPVDDVFPGTGRGTPKAIVAFTPGLFPPARSPVRSARAGSHVHRADAALLHELVHALEDTRGTHRMAQVGLTADGYARTGEHRAIRVTNMYRSETGHPLRGPYNAVASLESSGQVFSRFGLRGVDHSRVTITYRGVTRAARDPSRLAHRQYVDFEKGLMSQFYDDLGPLCSALEQVPRQTSEYNPFRDYRDGTYPTVFLPALWEPGWDFMEEVPTQETV